MSRLSKEEKLVQFRIREDFLKQVDEYWPKTGKFSSRSQFIKYLLLEELNSKRLASGKDTPDLRETLKGLKLYEEQRSKKEEELMNTLLNLVDDNKGLKERLEIIEKFVKEELGESLDNHIPQD